MVTALLLGWLRCRELLGVVDGRPRKAAKLGKLKLEVDIVQVVDE